MYTKHFRYPTFLIAALLVFLTSVNAESCFIYLEPDTVKATSSIGTHIDFELRVDAVTEMRAYSIEFTFDPTKLSVVDISEGPLPPLGGTTMPVWGLEDGDTILYIENFVFGWSPGSFDGPGVLAYITLEVIDTGFVDLFPLDVWSVDINGDPVLCDSAGAALYLDYPPTHFDLLEPAPGSTVMGTLCPDDWVTFTWGESWSVYPGESVTYSLEYSDDPAFGPGNTTTISGLTGVTHQVSATGFSAGMYYWRVTAIGDMYGYSRPSTPSPASFEFTEDDDDSDGVGNDCDNCPVTHNPGQEDDDTDEIGNVCDNCPNEYNPGQEDGDADEVGDICDNCLEEYNPTQSDLDNDAVGDICDNCPLVFNPEQADSNSDGQGDACDCDCGVWGDVNCDDDVNPVDVVFMVNYVYKNWDSRCDPPSCPMRTGDVNCDDQVNPVDVVYYVNYVYKNWTPFPCDPCAP